jgi:3-oxoacyl-[acyl-carrier protein] reductase/2-hydroxycyclohexanecarboxyl-CoA dehydrogenase
VKLANKVAIVTGAGRGIGEAISHKLACEGATVVCADINLADACAVARACGGECVAEQVDVSDAGACDALVEKVVERFGRLDILVNNAGINRDSMVHKMTDQAWDAVIAVDLSGVFYMIRAASRVMREQHAGKIVNISSVSSQGNIGQANYAAAKAGVVGLTRTVAKELARFQVTANAICPGFINTHMTRGMPDSILEQFVETIPLGRIGEPTDIANVVAFLASEEASYVTGEVITVGGGLRL